MRLGSSRNSAAVAVIVVAIGVLVTLAAIRGSWPWSLAEPWSPPTSDAAFPNEAT